MNRLAMSLLTALLLSPSVFAQRPAQQLLMGKMWTFENPPLAYLEKEYGFKPDQKWLDSLRLGTLRLGEEFDPQGSASFVSPNGLIMTSQHCMRSRIAEMRGNGEWLRNGFAATALEDEQKMPGMIVHQLVAQEDITAKVQAAIDADNSEASPIEKRNAAIGMIVQAADRAHPEYLHQALPLYYGAVYQLYRYRVWDDLRLVVAPHLQTAHFGGTSDSGTFPQWSIDFAFLRAYVDDKPADTSAHYFRWRKEGAKEGELVFATGNPGDTSRQTTMQQLNLQREVESPMVVEQYEHGAAILEPLKGRGAIYMTMLLDWQNNYKTMKGILDGLKDPALILKKQQLEQHFRGVVAEDKDLGREYGDLWRELNKIIAKQRELMPKAMFHQPGTCSSLRRGMLIAQSFDPSLEDYKREEARRAALNFIDRNKTLTHALAIDQFERASNWLRADDPFLVAAGGKHRSGRGTDWAAAIGDLSQSKLTRDAFVKMILTDPTGEQQWQESDDVAVQAARVLWPLMQAAKKQQAQIDEDLLKHGTRYGRALLEVYGSNISAAGTMTPRFSDGRVKGYAYNGTTAPWATTFYGLFGRGIGFGNKYPFDIPPAWLESESQIDMSKKVCFVSTNDIANGSSGSCLVDQNLQVVGLAFDGNIESQPNDFCYTQETARAVSVHTDAIIEALQKVYGMMRIVDELRDGAGR